MKNEIGDFLDYLTYERNVSINTVTAYRDDLESFVFFLCDDYFTLSRDQLEWRKVDRVAVRSYLAFMARQKLSRASMARHLSTLRTFFRFLMREEIVESNPARTVTTPKRENVPNVRDPRVWANLMGEPKKEKEPPKPKLVVDVFRGDKHVQEVFP